MLERRLILIFSNCNVIYLGLFFCPSTQSCWFLIGGCCIFFVCLLFSLWSFWDCCWFFEFYKKHHHHHKSMFGQTGLYLQQERWGGRRHLSCCFFAFLKGWFGFSLVLVFLSKWVVYKAKCEFDFDDCQWWSAASQKN